MKVLRRVALPLVALSCLVAGCYSGAHSTPSVTPTASASPVPGLPLPTLPVWPLPSNSACGGVGLGPDPFTLEGSPSDGVYGRLGSGYRIPTQWPPGYFATFEPKLAVHAPDGSVIAHAGDSLDVIEMGGLYLCTTPDVIQFLPFSMNA